jgi:hypothetical protein
MGIIINGQNDTIGPVDSSMSLLGAVSIGGTMTIEDFTNIDSVGLITARNGVNITAGDVNLTSGNLELASATPMVVASNGTGHLRLGAGGSEKVRITDGGQVRIGNSTITVSNSADDLIIGLDSPGGDRGATIISGTSGTGNIFFSDTDTSGVGNRMGTITYDHSGNFMRFSTAGNNERLRITSAGNVGINETSPDTYLHVKTGTDSALAKLEQTATNGRVQVQYLSPHGDWLQGIVGASNSGDYLIYTGQSKNLTFHTSGELRQKIQGDGKVILGGNANQTANRDLSVVAAQGNSNEAQIGLQPTNSSGGYNPEAFISALADGTYGAHMYFKTRDTSGNRLERLRITSAGRVGVNIGSPNTVLHIKSTQNSDGLTVTKGSNVSAFLGHNGSGDEGLLTLKEGGTTKIQLYAETNQDSYINSGDFGIGTNSPTNKLHVQSSSDTGEIRLGGGNGPGEHRLFFQAHPSTAYIDSYGNNTHNPLYINADPLILNTSGSGKVLIKTTTNNDNQAHLLIDGTTACGNIITGRIHDSTNNNNRTVLLFRMNQSNGFQFSGDIMVNSWTGNAKVNCHITVLYTNQNVEVDVVNATHSSQISKTNLRVVTADYGSNRYLGIQKNGGGTGVFYINALVSSNIDSSGNGGIREVNNSSLGSVTNIANLN